MELKFRTVSSVILSGRNSFSLYKGIDYKEVSNEEISIIYPFYSYENRNNKYNKIFEKANSYYIPASSLKGSLLVNKKNEKIQSKEESLFRQNVIFKDVLIKKEQIALKNLWKFQYLYQELKENNESNKKPIYDKFFPAIRIEMLKHDSYLIGNILIKNFEEEFQKRMDKTFSITKDRLKKYEMEIDVRIQKIEKLKLVNDDYKEARKKLEKTKNAINQLRKSDKKYIFLGGYKGILGSMTITEVENKNIRNGFYIDEETMLPYGLVEVMK